MSWFADLPASTQVALIGAGAVLASALLSFLAILISVILRDFLAAPTLASRKEKWERESAALSIYRTYADPLAAAATSVFWRLYEAFYKPGRSEYLRVPRPQTKFQLYKKESTVYRLAALFGWIRAFRRELSFFTLDDKTRLHKIEEAILKLEDDLAEGRLAELDRARDLAALWEIPLPADDEAASQAALNLEHRIKHDHKLDDLWLTSELSRSEKIAVCKTAYTTLRELCGTEGTEPEVPLEEELLKGVAIIAIREAWIFRDQQAAIGDLMIKEVSSDGSGRRRFEIKGYEEFNRMRAESGNERESSDDQVTPKGEASVSSLGEFPAQIADQVTVELIDNMLDRLDVSGKVHMPEVKDDRDSRVYQLYRTLLDCAHILVSIAEIRERPGSVSDKTLEKAREVIDNDKTKHKSCQGKDSAGQST